MKDHTGDIRAFTHLNRSWYSAYGRDMSVIDQVMFGYYSPEGGTSGEMAMRWYDLGGDAPAPRLEVYGDAWHALSTFADVVTALAEHDNDDISPAYFCAMLTVCGFVDRTETEKGAA